jgi:hypothetical protein
VVGLSSSLVQTIFILNGTNRHNLIINSNLRCGIFSSSDRRRRKRKKKKKEDERRRKGDNGGSGGRRAEGGGEILI